MPELRADRADHGARVARVRSLHPAPSWCCSTGSGTSGEIQNAYLGLEAPVDANGMLYVYPDGTENHIGRRFWNATEALLRGAEDVTPPPPPPPPTTRPAPSTLAGST